MIDPAERHRDVRPADPSDVFLMQDETWLI
jgi:hypothetical protein